MRTILPFTPAFDAGTLHRFRTCGIVELTQILRTQVGAAEADRFEIKERIRLRYQQVGRMLRYLVKKRIKLIGKLRVGSLSPYGCDSAQDCGPRSAKGV